MLASLLRTSQELGELVPVPQGLLSHTMTTPQHTRYRSTLGGLTHDDIKEVTV